MRASILTPARVRGPSRTERLPRGQFAPFLIAMMALVAIYALFPLGTALELGGDEGFELTKGFLWSKGLRLYRDVWCDQPPLFTLMLGSTFQVFGPSLLAARLIAAGFGLILVAVFYGLVRQRSSAWAALAAFFLLIASPGVLRQSVSVMVEVPTIGIALVSAWLLREWTERGKLWWLLGSGVVMGLALQIKLTAVMVVPAMLLEIALVQKQVGLRGKMRGFLLDAARWGLAVGLVFAATGLSWGSGSLATSLKSHTLVQAVPGLRSPTAHAFAPSLFLDHLECVAGAGVALVLVTRQGRWREAAFPMAMLATALAVHALHRPWWNYYYLHLAVPLAWLAGLALVEVFQRVARLLSEGRFAVQSAATWKGVGLGILTALALAVAEARLEGTIKALRGSPRAGDSPVLAKMRQYAGRTHWVYAQAVIYPFHAGLAVPPELAVMVLKRFWSGQITTADIVEICRRYKPEQLLLFHEHAGHEWKGLLDADYTVAYEDSTVVLFVSNRIKSQ
jgi:4-amino-4-deoxy-L-arabinose transferase-like glycosyltransferase